ncbi:MAG: 6-pyruvoyl-tetrahydropterin synthase-related protein [Candidatus Promineifilaceae bacterium]
MRSLLRRVDPGFVVVLALCLIAIWPFISRASLPEGTDAELHIFRLAELSYLLRGGEFYPRWAPNFYHGYGYPIFNYYAPLTYYAGFLVDILPRLDPVDGVKAVFIAGMLMAAFGMYGFVRDNWGRRAGYVAAAAFIYAPYVQYIDPHARGVLPESFSFGVFTLALWALDRTWRSGGRRPYLAAAFLVAAVILSHNLMGLLFFGLLTVWAAWRVLFTTLPEQRAAAARNLALALAAGLGMSAIFWLPVFAERSAVNLSTLIGQADNYDFHTHFLSLRELLAPSLRLDWGASEPAFRFNLGVTQWLLGGLGLVLLLVGKVKQPRHLAFFALALAVLSFLMLPASTFIWETVPFLPFFQFPWRLLGPTAALLAVLAGAGAGALLDLLPAGAATARGAWRSVDAWMAAALVALPMIAGLPLSQPAPWPDFNEVNQLRMTLIENTGRWLGTTSTADYVPVTVESLPQRKGSVVANFGLGLPPDRVNYDMLPEGATIETEVVSPLHTRYILDTPRATRLRLYLFDFPGWQASIDGQPAQKELGKPEGFIVIPVPEGLHTIDVRFGSTPPRTAATAIALFSLLAALFIAWRLPGVPGPLPARPFVDGPILLVVVLLTAVFALFLEPSGVLHYNSSGSTAEPVQEQLYADLGEQIALLGYDISTTEVKPGDTLYLTLYWKAQQPLDINYQVFVHLLGPDGLVAQSDKINPGDFPTRRWPIDKYVRDEHQIVIPSDLAPGRYELATGLWVQSDGWRLPLVDDTGQQIGDRVPIIELVVQ